MAEVVARCPDCNSAHHVHRGVVVTASTNGKRTRVRPTGNWLECFCGAIFLALPDGVQVLRHRLGQGQPGQMVVSAPSGAQITTGEPPVPSSPPEDRRPRPNLPQARP